MQLLQTWRARPVRIEPRPRVEIAILVVAFVFLYFFLTQPAPHGGGIGFDVPRVRHPQFVWGADREDALTVAVARDGSVYFRTDKVWPARLVADLKRARAEGDPSRPLYIRADRRVRYKEVSEVIAAARTAGITQVTFIVWQSRAGAPAVR